ncbi:hypothetical protein D0867_01120 [Hortaea werneckii]|uniref:Uncharacterized protein n=1 Tax=Hortaea werneckii TaxID=91943 RepID=A0A3M7ABK1_HORWE|nr:hypothetical protein D0867_01120 [Hortaea werneckii]
MAGMSSAYHNGYSGPKSSTKDPAPAIKHANQLHDRPQLEAGGHFADPYLLCKDTKQGQAIHRAAEFRPSAAGSSEARTEGQIASMLDTLASRPLRPAEIPGHRVLSYSSQQISQLWQSWSIIGSHLAAAVYREKYGELDRAKNALENSKATVGHFGIAPISDILYDSAIGVDDIDRTNGIHGAGLGDQRHIILLNKADDGRLEVAAVTSFGGASGESKGRPPRGQEHNFGLLITELDQAPAGTCVIRYSEVPLTKPGSSWVRLNQIFKLPAWAPVTWGKGRIGLESYDVIADAFKFEVGHRLRVEGARRKREWNAKVASCGYDATKLEERRIRQEREMKQEQQEAQLAASERAQRAKRLHEQQGRFCSRPFFWEMLTWDLDREFERRSAGTGSQAVRDPAIEDDVAESSQVEGLST